MIRSRNFLLSMLSLLGFIVWLPYIGQSLAHFDNAYIDMSCYYCVVPVALAALLLSPLMSRATEFLPRLLLGLSLALFLWSGFASLFVFDYPTRIYPWTGYLIYGLILGVALIAIVSRRVASLGPIKLTVFAGFVLALTYDLLNFAYGYMWGGIFNRLSGGWEFMRETSDWVGDLLSWLQYTDWVSYRLIAYIGLGYLLARRKGFAIGMGISMLVALADNTLTWLVLLPVQGEFELPPFTIIFQHFLPEVIKAFLAQVVDLSIFALCGALVTLVHWPTPFRRPLRFVSVTKARRRPARRITPAGE